MQDNMQIFNSNTQIFTANMAIREFQSGQFIFDSMIPTIWPLIFGGLEQVMIVIQAHLLRLMWHSPETIVNYISRYASWF